MYTIIFTDEKQFILTREQIKLIPYFNVLLTSSSFLEKNLINIASSSIGFEYIHMYATMDEIDIIDPSDKYLFAIKQCDYFGYDKLKNLLEKKYGYRADITDVKEKVGNEITVKMKYLRKINIIIDFIDVEVIPPYKQIEKIKITPYDNGYWCKFNGIFNGKQINMGNGIVAKKYLIYPLYEYPNYSTDDEINEIYKKRYRLKYNTYFVKMIQDIISFDKKDIICVKIKDSYKLLSETTNDEYKNIECIIMDNEPKFNDIYFIKHIDDYLEIFEII